MIGLIVYAVAVVHVAVMLTSDLIRRERDWLNFIGSRMELELPPRLDYGLDQSTRAFCEIEMYMPAGRDRHCL